MGDVCSFTIENSRGLPSTTLSLRSGRIIWRHFMASTTQAQTTGTNGQANGQHQGSQAGGSNDQQQGTHTTSAATTQPTQTTQAQAGGSGGQQPDTMADQMMARLQELINVGVNTGIREGMTRLEDSLANILRPHLGYDPTPFMPSMGGGFGTPHHYETSKSLPPSVWQDHPTPTAYFRPRLTLASGCVTTMWNLNSTLPVTGCHNLPTPTIYH